MLYFDLTKTGSARHRSGLTRVSSRLRDEWGSVLTPVVWPKWDRAVKATDWFFTSELFSDAERHGWAEWLRTRACRRAAVFHDAIPLKFPHITWPQSVGRHASYMKELALFDRVFAVSETSRLELLEFWRWQGVKPLAEVSTIALGADGLRQSRPLRRLDAPGAHALAVGILEPRKNQTHVLDVAEDLWTQGLAFTLHVVGRVNPHFGRPLAARIRALRRRFPGRLEFYDGAGDAVLAKLYARARVTVFPTLAEGCGLPLLESLWFGVPCLCNDLPVLRENTEAGGCLAIPVADRAGWAEGLRRILTDDTAWQALADEAVGRRLPTWSETAASLRAVCD